MKNTEIKTIQGIEMVAFEREEFLLNEINDIINHFDMLILYIDRNEICFSTLDNEFKLYIEEYESRVDNYKLYHGQENINKCERVLL